MPQWFRRSYFLIATLLIVIGGFSIAKYTNSLACSEGISVYSKGHPEDIIFELKNDKNNISINCACYFEKRCKTDKQVFYYAYTQDGINFGPESYGGISPENNVFSEDPLDGELIVRMEVATSPNLHLHPGIKSGNYRDQVYGLEYYPLHPIDKWYFQATTGTEYYLARNYPELPWEVDSNYVVLHCPGGSPQFRCFAKFMLQNNIRVQILFERNFIPQWKTVVERAINQIIQSNPTWIHPQNT